MAPERVRLPAPAWVRLPVPEMMLATERALLRLKTKAALFVTAPDPRVPVVPASPTCRVPAEIVSPPEKSLAPESFTIPAPVFVIAPTPVITPWKIAIESASVASSVAVLFTVMVPVLNVVVPTSAMPSVPVPAAATPTVPVPISPEIPKSAVLDVMSLRYQFPPAPDAPKLTSLKVMVVPAATPCSAEMPDKSIGLVSVAEVAFVSVVIVVKSPLPT